MLVDTKNSSAIVLQEIVNYLHTRIDVKIDNDIIFLKQGKDTIFIDSQYVDELIKALRKAGREIKAIR